MDILSRLTQGLTLAGIPLDGVALLDGVAHTVRLDFMAAATQPQRDAAQALVAAFDWSDVAQAAWELQQHQATIGAMTIRRTSAGQSNSTITLADVTGLSFELAPNSHYRFRFVGGYTSAVGTTGLSLAVNGPASPLWMSFAAQIAMTGATAAFGVGTAYNTPSTAPTGGGATPLPFTLEGTISTGDTGGTLSLRFASEVGGSTVTILRGTIGELAAAA